MQSYIVRVYRSEGKNPRRLVGVVEEVGVDGKRAFHTPDELWEIVTSSKRRGQSSGRSTSVEAEISAKGRSSGKNSSGNRVSRTASF